MEERIRFFARLFKFNNIYVMILKILKVIDLQEHKLGVILLPSNLTSHSSYVGIVGVPGTKSNEGTKNVTNFFVGIHYILKSHVYGSDFLSFGTRE